MRRLTLLALVVLFAGSSDARPLKGGGPWSLAVGYGSVWVGYCDGRVDRVDAETRRITRILPRQITACVASLATGFGSVWAARHDGTVVRIDGRTGRVLATLSTAWFPSDVAAGRGFVWVADNERALFRVDPRTNRVTGRKRVPGRLWGDVAAGRGGVWVQTVPARRGPLTGPVGPRVVWQIHPRTLAAIRTMRLDCDGRLAVTTTLWVLDTCDGTVTRRGGPRIDVSHGGSDLAIGAGSLWVAEGLTLHRVDIARRAVAARIAAKGFAVRVGAGAAWVLDHGDGTVGWLRRIDLKTDRVAGQPIRLSAR